MRTITFPIAAVGSALLLLATSYPGGVGWMLTLAVALWLVAFSSSLIDLRREGGSAGRQVRLFLLTVFLAINATIVLFDLPLHVRFGLSRSAFERLASDHPSYEVTSWSGLYDTCCFEDTDFGYRLGVTDTGTTIWGFAFAPGGKSPGRSLEPFVTLKEGEEAYRHLDGDWYVWEYAYS